MQPRSDLHTILVSLLGSTAVYFQPPTGTEMVYPCITYKLSDVDTKFADNNPYSLEKEYLLTVMDEDPDTQFPDKVLVLPKCTFDRHFTANNLNHYVFRIFF